MKIVSGGQTGADRAAHDAAIEVGLPCGGWVPAGRTDEKGRIPAEYPGLVESESSRPAVRTRLNVRDSDATLIVSHGPLTGGSDWTRVCAEEIDRPWLHVDLEGMEVQDAVRTVSEWLVPLDPAVLNVAGPRASKDSRIYDRTRELLRGVLAVCGTAFESTER